MTVLTDLRPTHKLPLMDLVQEAGIDVSDWKNFRGGAKSARRNPKYCYEWAFEEPGKVVVLNIWHAELRQRDGAIVVEKTLGELAQTPARDPQRAVWRKRARKVREAIRKASIENLPVRVVILDGQSRSYRDSHPKASQVNRRLLDPVPWAVTSYDLGSGRSTLTRGASPARLVDQFSLEGDTASGAERRPVSGEAFVRNPDIRRRALERANGHCEFCGLAGFQTPDGGLFLETHHVIPLGEGGADTLTNVAALCPNHHREAHQGANRTAIRNALLNKSGPKRAERVRNDDTRSL